MKWIFRTIVGAALAVSGGCAALGGFVSDAETLKAASETFGLQLADTHAETLLQLLKFGGIAFGGLGGAVTIWQFFFASKPPSAARIKQVFADMKGVEFASGRHKLTDSILHNRPADILLARFQAVPFDDRARHLEGLMNWCAPRKTQTVRDVHVRLIAAGGGVGKTRLAIEAIETLRKKDWVAGFLPGAATDSKEFVPVMKTLLRLGRPMGYFIVLDYAELRPKRIEALISALANLSDRKGKPVRVLLLARSDDWWRDIAITPDGAKIAERDANKLSEKAELSDAARGEIFAACIRAFSHTMKKSGVTVASQDPKPPADLTTNPLYDRPLTLAMAAFLALRGADRTDGSFNLFDALLDEEKRNWQRAAQKTADEAQADERAENIRRGAGQVTLLQGAKNETIITLRAADPARNNDPALEHRAAATSLCRIYPNAPADKSPGAGPIEPDILGEAALARLSDAPDGLALLQATLLSAIADEANEADPAAILAVLIRMWSHPEAQTQAAARLILSDWTEHVVPGLSLPYVDRMGAAIGLQTIALADLALALADRRLALSPGGETEDQMKSRADALIWQGIRLSALGRREDALAATEEAVSLYKDLAKARPDAFTPDLAASLNNLGIRLSELGRREDALAATEEAVSLRRDLAKARPDAFNPDLAGSLNNLGMMFSDLGRREDALAATEEAVTLYRDLAKARPDAFTPDLAGSLSNLGSRLSALGRREDALAATEEAVTLYRDLAKARLDAFNPDLARSLNNLGIRLSELGRREDALAATEEAVSLYKDLAKARPDAFTPDLAASLDNLGQMFSNLGRREDALAATEEAVTLRRDLAKARPDAFNPDLARSLTNLGNRLSDLGRREDALAATEEAVTLRRDLATARPDAFNPDLAGSLGAMGQALMGLGRADDASATFEEGLTRLDAHYRSYPGAFMGMWNLLKSELQRALEAIGLPPEEIAARMKRWD